MTAEKRFLLAMSLSLMVVFIWSQMTLQRKRELQKQEKEKNLNNPEQEGNQNKQDKNQKNLNNENNPKKNQEGNPKNNKQLQNNPKNNVPKNNNQIQDIEEKIIVVETDKYYMEWTSRGGALKSLRLKNFLHSDVDPKKKDKGKEDWFNIIPQFDKAYPSLIFSNYVESNGKIAKNFVDNWEVVDETNENPKRLIFQLGPVDGMSYEKIFTFTEENKIEGKVVITNISGEQQVCYPSIGGSSGINWECSEGEVSRFITLHHLFRNKNNNPVSSYEYYDTAIADTDAYSVDAPFSWVAVTNKYFANILEVEEPKLVKQITTQPFSLSLSYQEKILQNRREKGETPPVEELSKLKMFTPVVTFNSITLENNAEKEISFSFRVDSKVGLADSKKEFTVLEDYGWFDVVARLLLQVLNFFAGIFHSYAIAIICMTLCIKLLLFPITKKQQISMKKYQESMQVLQPQMKKIQQKHKNNRQKMNQEVMALYKKHGVNPIPVGGCLPVFIQIPIFIALYNVLLYSIVLRQESFLWISDLAQPDKFMLYKLPFLGDYLNILPIIMTVLWILQQKLMPKAGSPEMQQQQKMFMFMTIFFGFLFYKLPAGLVMYWLTMNFISICEQLIIRKFKTT